MGHNSTQIKQYKDKLKKHKSYFNICKHKRRHTTINLQIILFFQKTGQALLATSSHFRASNARRHDPDADDDDGVDVVSLDDHHHPLHRMLQHSPGEIHMMHTFVSFCYLCIKDLYLLLSYLIECRCLPFCPNYMSDAKLWLEWASNPWWF